MKLDSNYLSRRKFATNHFAVTASLMTAVAIVSGDFKSDPLGSIQKYGDLLGQAVDFVKSKYTTIKRDVFGNWNDIRGSWEQGCQPYFLPKSTPADQVFQLALTQAAAMSDLCQKNKYSMNGHGTYAWFMPWIMYFDTEVSLDDLKYYIWAKGQNWGGGYAQQLGTEFFAPLGYPAAYDKVQSGRVGWCISFYTPKYAFYSDWYNRACDVFKIHCVDKVLQVVAEAQQPKTENKPVAIVAPSGDWRQIAKDFEKMQFKHGKKYAWGNNGTYHYFDTRRVPKHFTTQKWNGIILEVGKEPFISVFGGDPMYGTLKYVFETDSKLIPNKYENSLLGNFGVSGKVKDFLKNYI